MVYSFNSRSCCLGARFLKWSTSFDSKIFLSLQKPPEWLILWYLLQCMNIILMFLLKVGRWESHYCSYSNSETLVIMEKFQPSSIRPFQWSWSWRKLIRRFYGAFFIMSQYSNEIHQNFYIIYIVEVSYSRSLFVKRRYNVLPHEFTSHI